MAPFDKAFRFFSRPWVIAGIAILIVLCMRYVDEPLAQWLHMARPRQHFPWLGWLTRLGLGPVWLGGFFLLGIIFHFLWKRPLWETRSWFLWVCTASTAMVCLILKVGLGRARPGMLVYHHISGFYGFQTNSLFWSFPSGHTTMIMSVVLGLGIVFPRYFKTLAFAGVLVAASRVILIHHYLSDVLFSAWLTLMEIGLLEMYLRYKGYFAGVLETRSGSPRTLQDKPHGV